jgi:hypothetical protein
MAIRKRLTSLRSAPLRRVRLSDDDIQAARKVLETLANAEIPAAGHGRRSGDPAQFQAEAVRQAREAAALRERRMEVFNFSAEPPFVILLALYANEEWEPVVNLTRLTQLVSISYSTSCRWLDVLVDEGLINRDDDADDGRKTLLALSPLGREKLNAVFGED